MAGTSNADEHRHVHQIADLITLQDGVVLRRQALDRALTPNDLRRLIRARQLVRVHPGVYVNHTGPLTQPQREWVAVLAAWPAALSHESALVVAGVANPRSGRGDDLVHVAMGHHRSVRLPPWAVPHRISDLDRRVQWNLAPPRLRIEEAAIALAAAATSELDSIATLARVVSSRRTTASRLLTALKGRTRIQRRAFLRRVLEDVETGTCSALEHGYLTRIEQPHGLPRGVRQATDPACGRLYRDVLYEDYGQVVELDGQLFHTGARERDRDLERDLDAAATGKDTIRLGWGQVFERPCRTAARIGGLLRTRGWPGPLNPCVDCA